MKSYLIIPMAGTGERFVKLGYKTYKVFLPIDKKFTILEKIVANFKGIDLQVIILANFKSFRNKYDKFLKRKNFHLINVENHKKGPLFTLYLAQEKINNIIKKNKNIFISYSDINWSWNIKSVLKFLKNKKITIFTHKNFHPHLEVNSRSDFCLVKNNKIINILEKKTFSKDYKNDFLALGCYYIKELAYINNFFKRKHNIFFSKKEFYLVTLIKYLIKNNIKVTNFNIENFVHLGIPDQYVDFLNWKNLLVKEKNNSLLFTKNSCVMLMAGKGTRVSKFKNQKPFLLYKAKPIYKYIFDKFGSKEKIVITNKNFVNKINKKKYKVFCIKETSSMFNSIFEARNILQNKSNYFLTSCDCFGNFNTLDFKKFIIEKKSDLTLFAFKYSNLQKNLGNSHTQLKIKNKKVYDVEVKKKYKNFQYGHAGFFWIQNGNIFKYLYSFKVSKYYKNLNREVLIDDYFKFLIKNKLIKASYFLLDNYVHIGSKPEYLEYLYWNNYFKKEYE